MHGDIRHTSMSSYAILNGHLSDFYLYNKSVVGGNDYDIFIYLIFALWNVPLYIAGYTAETLGSIAMLYNKLLPIIFWLLSAYVLYRIIRKSKISARSAFYIAFMSFTTVYVLVMCAGMGMYDSLYMFFILMGIYFFTRESSKWDMLLLSLIHILYDRLSRC